MSDRDSQGKDDSAVARYRRRAGERRDGPPQWLEPAPRLTSDTLWRGLTRGGEIRFLVLRISHCVRDMLAMQAHSDASAKVVATAMAAVQLVRSTLNPEAQMQMIIDHDGGCGQVVVDAWPEGGVRAMVTCPQPNDDGQPLLGTGTCTLVRYSPRGGAYRSSVTLAEDGIEGAIMRYMLESEQILCMLRAEVDVKDGEVRFAGGHMLQVTPEGTGRDLQRLLGNLQTLDGLGEAMSSDDPDGRRWSQQMMQGFDWDQCARQQVAFECRCSRDRVLSMLSTLGRSDLEELRDSDEPVSLTCEYCKSVYTIGPVDIGALLEPPS